MTACRCGAHYAHIRCFDTRESARCRGGMLSSMSLHHFRVRHISIWEHIHLISFVNFKEKKHTQSQVLFFLPASMGDSKITGLWNETGGCQNNGVKVIPSDVWIRPVSQTSRDPSQLADITQCTWCNLHIRWYNVASVQPLLVEMHNKRA